MKSYQLLTAFAVAGFLSFDAAQAQTYRLNFKLTLQAQDMWREYVGSSPVQKSTVVKIKVTNKEMLKLRGVSYGQDFTGDMLALHSGHFQVRDSTGNTVVRDATSGGVMANFDAMKSSYVRQEIIDNSKGTYNGTGYCTSVLAYADMLGNQFSMNGSLQDSSKHNSGGSTYSFKMTSGTGTGHLNTPPAGADPLPLFIITGTLDGKSY